MQRNKPFGLFPALLKCAPEDAQASLGNLKVTQLIDTWMPLPIAAG